MLRNRGFTLPEALLTAAIGVVMTSMAIGSFARSVAQNRRAAVANELLGAVQAARLEAAKRQLDVVICPDNGAGRCAGTTGAWSQGYLVFVDRTPGRPYQMTSQSDLLARKAAAEGVTLTANREAFIMRPLAWRSSNGTVTVCSGHPRVPPRAVIISVMGRPRVSARRSGGGPIDCPPA